MLKVDNLRLGFTAGKTTLAAVDGISFAISKGETFALLGESGCGKSATAQGIMRLLPAAGRILNGKVALEDEELLSLSEAEMRAYRGGRMAMIFQEPATSLNPVLTVGRQIGEVLERHLDLRGEAATGRMIDLLRQVGIADPERRLTEYPFQLSGGMKQRVVIAMALAADADLIVADEPTTALDVTVQAQIVMILSELVKKRDMGLILITHDMGVVAQICDSVCVLYAGRVAESGPVGQIFAAPRHPDSHALIGCIPQGDMAPGALRGIPGAVPSAAAYGVECCRFAARCPRADDVCRSLRPLPHPQGAALVACHHPEGADA